MLITINFVYGLFIYLFSNRYHHPRVSQEEHTDGFEIVTAAKFHFVVAMDASPIYATNRSMIVLKS